MEAGFLYVFNIGFPTTPFRCTETWNLWSCPFKKINIKKVSGKSLHQSINQSNIFYIIIYPTDVSILALSFIFEEKPFYIWVRQDFPYKTVLRPIVSSLLPVSWLVTLLLPDCHNTTQWLSHIITKWDSATQCSVSLLSPVSWWVTPSSGHRAVGPLRSWPRATPGWLPWNTG